MKEQILQAIEQFDTIIIHRHIRPDPDALGSQCGLGTMLQASFPEKHIYMTGVNEPTLAYMRKMDEVDDSTYKHALVIVCDTANEDRICDQRYKNGKMLIKIDHHPNATPYGDLLWVDTGASSCSEMIYEFYLYGQDKGLVLTEESARLIFGGIVGDTGRFLFRNTSPKTFEYAAQLVATGIDFPALYNEMYKTSVSLSRLNGYILQNFELTEEGASYIKISRETMENFGVTTAEASSVVGTLGSIAGIRAWVLFLEEEESIRVRLRSKGLVINKLAAQYNGGGHPLASGATVYSWEEADALIEDLRALCR